MNDPQGLSVFDEILAGMNEEGKFTLSVLVSEHGWPIAEAPTPSSHDATTVAAMVSLIRDFVQQTQEHLKLADVDEVSIVIHDRSRLICRYFDAAGKRLILAVIAPPDQTYRRLTSRTIHRVRAELEQQLSPEIFQPLLTV